MNSHPDMLSPVGRALATILLLASFGEAPAGADTPLSMVTPEWVAKHYQDPDVRILDVRPDPHDYFAGHVPYAVHLADGTLRGPLGGVPVQYQSPEVLAHLLARAGVTNDHHVVVYSDGENVLGATMVAYVLERLGHKKVKVMDGGWTAYKAAHKTTQAYPKYTPGKLKPNDVRSIYVTLDEVKKLVGKNGHTFIDARPEKAYLGQVSTWVRNGHIPGAINLDWHALVDGANPHQLKPLDEIKRLVAAKGIDRSADIILYCGTSREASLEYVVLKHLLGFSKVRLYEGSWTEYSSHPELPVETTAARTEEKDGSPADSGGYSKKTVRAVVHINFGDTGRQGQGLKNVQNILKEVKDKASIEVVVHAAGIPLVVKGKSVHAEQVQNLMKQGVRFVACENTMREKSIKKEDLLPGVGTVPAGAVEVLRKQQEGYGYFRP